MVKNFEKEDIQFVITCFSKELINDYGYNKCYAEAQKYNNRPSLCLLTFWFIINFEKYLHENNKNSVIELTRLEKDGVIRIIEECKRVNNIEIKKGPKNEVLWDKNQYYSLVKKIIEKYCNLFSSYESIVCDSIEGLLENYMNIFNEYNKGDNSKKSKYPMFDDVVGLEKAKEVIMERIIKPNKYRDVYKKYKVKVGGGILLYGLPGTGKTMFAQAVANEINGHFIAIKSSDIKSKWFGETENKVKELFDEARKYPVSVLFFDEFEAIGVSRDKQGNEVTAGTVVPEMLAQMQGFQDNKNIILVIAATNRPWDIDTALLRPGRLDSLVYVDLPSYETRKIMFEKQLKQVKIESDIIEYLAKYTDGYNGSDIKGISDNIIRLVIDKEINGQVDYEIQFEDCVEILKKTSSSVSRNDLINMKRFIEFNNKN